MRIIDAHHHYWDLPANYHPWLIDEPMIPFRYGDYSSIRKTFLEQEYQEVSKGWNVVATVTMEGEWDPQDPIGEARWIEQFNKDTTKPAAHAAQAWLDRVDLPGVLQVLEEIEIIRSIRHKPRANTEPGGPTGGMADRSFIEGFGQLARHDLMFELQTPWWHLQEAIKLAATSPDTPIILNHTGLPSDRSAEGIKQWNEAIQHFAKLPQTLVKISGLGLRDKPWSIDDNRAIILRTIDCFGTDRTMFASNYPVDSVCGSFNTIYQGFDDATRSFTDSERDALFAANAARVYRIQL